MRDPFFLNIEAQIKTRNLIEKLGGFQVQFGKSFVEYYCTIQFGHGCGIFKS